MKALQLYERFSISHWTFHLNLQKCYHCKKKKTLIERVRVNNSESIQVRCNKNEGGKHKLLIVCNNVCIFYSHYTFTVSMHTCLNSWIRLNSCIKLNISLICVRILKLIMCWKLRSFLFVSTRSCPVDFFTTTWKLYIHTCIYSLKILHFTNIVFGQYQITI